LGAASANRPSGSPTARIAVSLSISRSIDSKLMLPGIARISASTDSPSDSSSSWACSAGCSSAWPPGTSSWSPGLKSTKPRTRAHTGRSSRAAITANQFSSAMCSADRTIRVTRSGVGGSIRSSRAAVPQQLLPHPVRVALSVRHLGRQPLRQLLGVDHPAHPKPQVITDLGAVVLDRPPGPVVQTKLRGRHLDLPGNVVDDLVSELCTPARESAMPRVELQQQREPQPRRTALARHQLQLVLQHRPVLDKLVHPHRLPTHGAKSSPNPQPRRA
jgi:hypothetical protein